MSVHEEEKTEKLFYTIAEVSEMFELSPSTIRFWEKEFDVLKPNKNKRGNRVFTPKDIEHISVIVQLVKEKGYTLEGARKQLKQRTRGSEDANAEVIAKLHEIRNKLIALRDGSDEQE